MSTKGEFITKSIAAGAVEPIVAQGTNFHVVFSPVDLYIKRAGGEFGVYQQGGGIENLPGGDTFNRLEVRNPSLGTVVVTIYVGGPLYRDSRHAVIEPDTIGIGQDLAAIPASSELDLSGIPSGSRVRRKSIQVSNLDANLLLSIRDIDDFVILWIFPRTSITLPISKPVKIVNENGSDLAASVSEIWWTL